jgi:hypothetical protein
VLELNFSVDKSVKSIIGTDTNILSGMNVSTSLSYDDVTCGYYLSFGLLNTKTLGLAVTTVLGRTYTLLMCEKL